MIYVVAAHLYLAAFLLAFCGFWTGMIAVGVTYKGEVVLGLQDIAIGTGELLAAAILIRVAMEIVKP